MSVAGWWSGSVVGWSLPDPTTPPPDNSTTSQKEADPRGDLGNQRPSEHLALARGHGAPDHPLRRGNGRDEKH